MEKPRIRIYFRDFGTLFHLLNHPDIEDRFMCWVYGMRIDNITIELINPELL